METYEHNFVKLAEDSGFAFNIHRPQIRIDWNKIRSIDIDRLIRERRFVTIEQHVNDILNCLLESEFDCRILDEGVVKLFRLAQLTVEYQQFCRHHLDKSVMLLREELASVMQELDKQKKNIRSKDDEIKKIRKKMKQTHKPIISSFGNENIAAMIIKTLSNNENIASPDFGDGIQQCNKCKYCDKVFLNQLYLKGHMLRRHQALIDQDKLIAENKVIENQQKTEQDNPYLAENIKLYKEIDELKNKLEDVSSKLEATHNKLTEIDIKNKKEVLIPIQETANTDNNIKKTTDTQEDILEKIEEWKLKEQEKYKSEINQIKEQILENINEFKIKQNEDNNIDVVQQFRNIVKNQNLEIATLKQELIAMTQIIEKISKERELELNKRLEHISPLHVIKVDAGQQYEPIGRSPNKYNRNEIDGTYVPRLTETFKNANSSQEKVQSVVEQNYYPRIEKLTERQKSLEELHRKTQELLNIESSTDSSCSTDQNLSQNKDIRSTTNQGNRTNYKSKDKRTTSYKPHLVKNSSKSDIKTSPKINKKKIIKKKVISKKYDVVESLSDDNPQEIINSSPAKIVRAKITEEVHKRLVSAGVDPLKTGVNNTLFEKQRTQLRNVEEIKKKKSPSYEKVRHKILAFLDSKATETLEKHQESDTIVKDNRRVKKIKLTSVLSNVKNKALSFIKSNDKGYVLHRKTRSEDIIQKENNLFKPPQSSVSDSPINRLASRTSTDSNLSSPIKKNKNSSKKTVVVEVNNHNTKSDSDSSEIDSIDEIYNEKYSSNKKSKSIDNLINSPAKKPYKINEKNSYNNKYVNDNHSQLFRTQSTSGLPDLHLEEKTRDETINFTNKNMNHNGDYTSPEKVSNTNLTKYLSDDNVFLRNSQNLTKGVLKNAPSTSSLSKKKVIFDLDANQTKSVSASPSQSNTEKSDPNAEDAIETLNLEEEWDISSIESVPVKASKENLTSSKTTPKIAELTQRIESQLAMRRDNKPPVGSIDVLRGLPRGGSNTSLGSSLPDDSYEPKPVSNKSILLDKDSSDIDLSEFSLDGISKDYKVNVK